MSEELRLLWQEFFSVNPTQVFDKAKTSRFFDLDHVAGALPILALVDPKLWSRFLEHIMCMSICSILDLAVHRDGEPISRSLVSCAAAIISKLSGEAASKEALLTLCNPYKGVGGKEEKKKAGLVRRKVAERYNAKYCTIVTIHVFFGSYYESPFTSYGWTEPLDAKDAKLKPQSLSASDIKLVLQDKLLKVNFLPNPSPHSPNCVNNTEICSMLRLQDGQDRLLG